jgi:hypothetical protein
MLVQEAGEKILLLPAWPEQWDADFKLHLSGGAVVRGLIKAGKLQSWQITPSSREKDVTVFAEQSKVLTEH